MNAPASVETVSTAADKAKLAMAAVLVVGAIAVFYLLGQKDMWLRVVALPGLDAPLLGMDVLGRMRWQQDAGTLRISPAAPH